MPAFGARGAAVAGFGFSLSPPPPPQRDQLPALHPAGAYIAAEDDHVRELRAAVAVRHTQAYVEPVTPSRPAALRSGPCPLPGVAVRIVGELELFRRDAGGINDTPHRL